MAAEGEKEMLPLCHFCYNPGDLRCGACKMAYYCSAQCQLSDWKRHQMHCIVDNAEPKEVNRLDQVRAVSFHFHQSQQARQECSRFLQNAINGYLDIYHHLSYELTSRDKIILALQTNKDTKCIHLFVPPQKNDKVKHKITNSQMSVEEFILLWTPTSGKFVRHLVITDSETFETRVLALSHSGTKTLIPTTRNFYKINKWYQRQGERVVQRVRKTKPMKGDSKTLKMYAVHYVSKEWAQELIKKRKLQLRNLLYKYRVLKNTICGVDNIHHHIKDEAYQGHYKVTKIMFSLEIHKLDVSRVKHIHFQAKQEFVTDIGIYRMSVKDEPAPFVFFRDVRLLGKLHCYQQVLAAGEIKCDSNGTTSNDLVAQIANYCLAQSSGTKKKISVINIEINQFKKIKHNLAKVNCRVVDLLKEYHSESNGKHKSRREEDKSTGS